MTKGRITVFIVLIVALIAACVFVYKEDQKNIRNCLCINPKNLPTVGPERWTGVQAGGEQL